MRTKFARAKILTISINFDALDNGKTYCPFVMKFHMLLLVAYVMLVNTIDKLSNTNAGLGFKVMFFLRFYFDAF